MTDPTARPALLPTLDDPFAPAATAPPADDASGYAAALRAGHELRLRPRAGGGTEQIARQHAKERMTVWERIAILSDETPDVLFENWGPQLDGASLVTAILHIGGRDVALYGHDFTVRAGSMDATNGRKLARLFQMAGEKGIPVIGLNDSAGAYVPAGVGGLDGYSEAFTALRKISGVVPSIMCMFGFNAGGGSYLPRQGSFVIQPADSFFGLTGPGVVKSVLGEDVSPDDLGGPKVHSQSGVADLTTPDEVGALRTTLRLLGYLPSHNSELAPHLPTSDAIDRPTPEIETLLHKAFTSPSGFNTPFDMSFVLQQIVDHGDYFELQPTRAKNTITAFGRVGGHVIGFVANNSAFASGQIDIAAAMKNARFIRFCNLYNIPLVFIEDTTGFLPGKDQEQNGIVHAGRAMLDAIIDVRTPRILLIVRNAFGGAYASFNCYPTGADLVLALPTTRVAVMGPAGKEFVYKDELRKVRAEAKRLERADGSAVASAYLRQHEADLSARYERELMNPREALSLGSISRIVQPGELRQVLGKSLAFLLRHYRPGPLTAVQREFHSSTSIVAPDAYSMNPMTTRDRRLGRAASAWVRSFACEDVRPLIVCRGPIRKEAIDTFRQMGIEHFGILLSEKDSIVYTHALAPEVRSLGVEQVHRIKDYSGASKDERLQRMHDIVAIAHKNDYTHVFAGYGFMAEDGEFVKFLEDAGLVFIGPASSVQFAAGLKDEAKRTALTADVSVTPGIDDATRRALLAKAPTHAALRALAAANDLDVDVASLGDDVSLADVADRVLDAAYAKRIDVYSIDELAEALRAATAELLAKHPTRRLRLKAIGGGGGKGQRILQPDADLAEVPALVREILAEVKAGGVGDNKNILVEMNIEETRHNEIQLIGNGTWCLALGGRDCSLQMHEQKLLEIALTDDGLVDAIARAEWLAADATSADAAWHKTRAEALGRERQSLGRMEAEAERFGLAVGLNSASTFECIVEGDHHFFMEVNTRIQVEHRVTELCYRLVFVDPEGGDGFVVESLVEAMVLIARHGRRLPRPRREVRELHAVEARLNATNGALEPHAGGLIRLWSDIREHEIRDDQGINVKNPDTARFMKYRLAGAYDSNIALLLTYGDSREQLYERLVDMLRRTRIRGDDLHTNLAFHVGLAQWFAARDVWARPTTRFVVPYLTAVGLLAQASAELDLSVLWSELTARRVAAAKAQPEVAQALARVLTLKDTLVRVPLARLLDEPHVLSAFLSRNIGNVVLTGERVTWTKNPLEVLADTYWLIGKEHRPGSPAANMIWDHDHALLERGLGFYRTLRRELGLEDASGAWTTMVKLLDEVGAPVPHLADRWPAIRAAHIGHQAGLELLSVLVQLGVDAGFFALRVLPDGAVDIPPRLLDKRLQDAMKKVLAPPPAMRSNAIVAVSGGMFYAREAPDRPPLVSVGSHFKVGDPLYIIEVMKMFNRVHAPFAGRVDEVLVEGGEGSIVQKGQPLFRVTPDEPIVEADPVALAAARRARSLACLDRIL